MPNTSFESFASLTGTASQLRRLVPSALRAPAAPNSNVRGSHLAAQRNTRKYWYFVVGVIAFAALWFFVDRPVSTDPVTAAVTQGVWKVQRYSNATYQGTAKVEDGALVNFTTYQSVPVGSHIRFYRHRRPISGFTTYEYAGP